MLKTKRGVTLIALLYVVSVTIGGRILFILPNKKYLSTLNTNEFYLLCLIPTLLFAVAILFTKFNEKMKMILVSLFTLVVFTSIGLYYYANLPQYTNLIR